jgi:hypothetical protein
MTHTETYNDLMKWLDITVKEIAEDAFKIEGHDQRADFINEQVWTLSEENEYTIYYHKAWDLVACIRALDFPWFNDALELMEASCLEPTTDLDRMMIETARAILESKLYPMTMEFVGMHGEEQA